MSLIVSKKARGGITISQQPGLQNQQLVRRRGTQSVIVRTVQPSQGQVSSPRKRRRNRNRNRSSIMMQAPNTFGGAFNSSRPQFNGAAGSLVLTHSEVHDEILGSSQFAGTATPLVPRSFPYLKGIAQNFSRYRWKRLSATFTTASPTSQGGTVAMGAVYDGLDNFPQTMGEVAVLAHGWIGPVWGPPGTRLTQVEFDCTRWSKPWYSYIDEDIPLTDSNTYVPAYLIFGKQTQVNGQVIGRIEYSYSIEFSDPIPAKMNSAPALNRGKALDIQRFGSLDDSKEPDPIKVMLSAITELLGKSELKDDPRQEMREIGDSNE